MRVQIKRVPSMPLDAEMWCKETPDGVIVYVTDAAAAALGGSDEIAKLIQKTAS